MERPKRTVQADVEALFSDEQVPRDVILQVLNCWIANLQATETRIDRELMAMLGVFAAFLALDTGILEKLSFQGADLERTGLLLAMAPIVMSYLYYRSHTQVSFVQDLRTAIALLYKKLHEPIYYGGFDLFAHVPTLRNLEAYDSLRGARLSKFYERTTDVVANSLIVGPLLALAYCFFRLWQQPDIDLVQWIITAVVSLIFVVRALLFGVRDESEDTFSTRKKPAI